MTSEDAISKIRVQVLGGGQDVGRSCLIATLDNDTRVMFDCGAHPGYADSRRFPDFSTVKNLQNLTAIVVTHYHVDHAAALPLLTETLGIRAPVYMTAATVSLSRLMLQDFLRTCTARSQQCYFDGEEAQRCLDGVNLITPSGPSISIGNLRISAYEAGHALGAVMFIVETDTVRIVYTGDYATRCERVLSASKPPMYSRPHLLITETTYCTTARRPSRAAQEEALMRAISTAILARGRVLFAVPALGRVQELCAVLDANWCAYQLRDTPVYIPDGLASRANAVYSQFAGETNSKTSQSVLHRAHAFNRVQHWDVVDGENAGAQPCILFATPGNLSTGLSLDVFHEWCYDERNLVVVPGFSFANTLAAQLGNDMGYESEKHEIRCQFFNLTLNSHADSDGIMQTIKAIRPHNVMLVHGERAKMLRFKTQVEDSLNIPVVAPRNSDIIDIEYKHSDQCLNTDTDAVIDPGNDGDLVKQYLAGGNACAPGFAGLGYEERSVSDVDEIRKAFETEFEDLNKISACEYRYANCVSICLIEEERSVVVEWAHPNHRCMARKVFQVLDKFV